MAYWVGERFFNKQWKITQRWPNWVVLGEFFYLFTFLPEGVAQVFVSHTALNTSNYATALVIVPWTVTTHKRQPPRHPYFIEWSLWCRLSYQVQIQPLSYCAGRTWFLPTDYKNLKTQCIMSTWYRQLKTDKKLIEFITFSIFCL